MLHHFISISFNALFVLQNRELALYINKFLGQFVTFLISEERSFLNQTFSDVFTHYQERITSSHEFCLSLCSFNQSCVAVSYDKNASTCFLSDKPEVIINTEQTSRLCSVKKVVSEELIVYGFSTNLAKGKAIYL